jgi:WD40 repeat protein
MTLRPWQLGLLVTLATASAGLSQAPKPSLTVLAAHGEMVQCLAFSPDGKTLASVSMGHDPKPPSRPWTEITLWDVATGQERRSFQGHINRDQNVFFRPSGIAFSHDGSRLVTGGSDHSVRLWDIETGVETASFSQLADQVNCVAFGPDGKTVAAAGPDLAWVWDVATRKELHAFRRPNSGYSPTFSPDLKTLASSCHQDMDLWDVRSGKLRLTLPDHRGHASHMAFSPDGKTGAVGVNREEGRQQRIAEVTLWDTTTGKERATFAAHTGVLWGLHFSHDGKSLVVMGADILGGITGVTWLDAANGQVLGTLRFEVLKESPRSTAFSPDGKLLALGCNDGRVRLWRVAPADAK